ncbi:MAG: hypothetical protein IJ662_01775 [Clostridia bacterium]|nr:hypothetical protein [Clostridia bacterium]
MILFVCTGNTCRSPMAAALARKYGVDAESAGISASPGAPASPGAVRAMALYGIDLRKHRARQVSEALLEKAQAVYCMGPRHAAALRYEYPEAAGKLRVFSPPIPDPYLQDDAVYRACAAALLSAMEREGILPPAESRNPK